MIEWSLKGKEFANCNCSYACPCQFNALPTHGNCCAIVGFQIDEGVFGDVKLDGVRSAAIYAWPGPVHEGNGRMQLIVDEKASDKQRDAMLKIMTGQETKDMATMWWVFNAMAPIAVSIDVDGRTGRMSIPGVAESTGRPIRNPVTGAEHRVRIDLPNGFEYTLAEIGSATSKTMGPIELNLNDSYGQFADLHLGNEGVIRQTAV